MTTALWILVVVVLLAAAVVAGWLRFRRPRRSDNALRDAQSPTAVAPPVAAPAVARVAAPAMDATPPSERDVLARLHAIAFDEARLNAGHAAAAGPAHEQVARFVATTLAHVKAGSGQAPRRPLLLPQLLQAVNDDDASVGDIGTIIARDPGLAGNLLRIANSALYRTWAQPVESIDRAVVLIGMDGIRHLIATALMQPVLGGGTGVFDRMATVMWRHGLLAAAAAAMDARHMGRDDAFRAQILGLVHALGAIMVVRTARDGYAQHAPLKPVASVMDALVERWAAPTARRLAQDWELSRDVAAALDEQQRDAPVDALGPLGRSLRVGRVAGAAALLHGRGTIDPAAGVGLLRSMSLDPEFADQVWERLVRAVAEPIVF